jgi:UDP-galactose transporter B1
MGFLELSTCIAGIYVCFLTWGVTQERVTSTAYDGQKFKFFIVLNLIQSLAACVVGFLYLKLRGMSLPTLSVKREGGVEGRGRRDRI